MRARQAVKDQTDPNEKIEVCWSRSKVWATERKRVLGTYDRRNHKYTWDEPALTQLYGGEVAKAIVTTNLESWG
eukprot:1588302-Amphidinium_carterae.1